jgi:putative transposase
LRQVDVLTSQGQSAADAIRSIGVSEVTYYRWRQEFGGLKSDQVKRLKDLEAENTRLRRAVSDLTLDKLILLEAARAADKQLDLFGLPGAKHSILEFEWRASPSYAATRAAARRGANFSRPSTAGSPKGSVRPILIKIRLGKFRRIYTQLIVAATFAANISCVAMDIFQ